jgi:hypothetical protein
MPVEAYKEKALLFTTHKNRVFTPDTNAADLLWAWAVGQASERAIPVIREELGEDIVAEAILKRGARLFVTAVAAQLLREQNGDDFVARVGTDGLFSKAMEKRLHKYAMLACLFYVQIVRSMVRSAGDIGTVIRRPDTADHMRRGVTERLISERLAPEAFAEKLPKLPGIA